jgi:hypothetical protein
VGEIKENDGEGEFNYDRTFVNITMCLQYNCNITTKQEQWRFLRKLKIELPYDPAIHWASI